MRATLLPLCLAAFASSLYADEATPSGGPAPSAPAALPEPDSAGRPISFQEAAAGLTAVFPIELNRMDEVAQNSYNWRGPADASLKCDIGFAPQALVVRGEFRDDLPFFQTMLRPAMPDWWRIQYGADGVEFLLDDPTSSTRRVRFMLNFGSAAVDPKVELLASPLKGAGGFLGAAALELEDAPGSAPEEGAVQFRVAIPYGALADMDFFRSPLRITVRLHDVDGDFATYLMMQEAIEKK